ncbi:DUF6932 family protein [Azospirillum sp. ST 5-10]|uniref:DUF6932 family protein n=1 Tax=unclassified Azospirillum TaxID=2630922 RepID=UPI003F4A1B11
MLCCVSTRRRKGTEFSKGRIPEGLLRYRAALHAVGLVAGFQWLDGSFMEDIETLEARSPRDVDIVTFFQLPAGTSQADVLGRHPELFDHDHLKAIDHVDGYHVGLGIPPIRLVQQSAYWYGVRSHRRNDRWKGFLEVGLAPDRDDDAAAFLKASGESS